MGVHELLPLPTKGLFGGKSVQIEAVPPFAQPTGIGLPLLVELELLELELLELELLELELLELELLELELLELELLELELLEIELLLPRPQPTRPIAATVTIAELKALITLRRDASIT